MLSDYELLIDSSNRLTERIRSAFGPHRQKMERIQDLNCALEKLMYGDIVNCDELDRFTRAAAQSHMQSLVDSGEEYDLGAVVGLIEQALVLGILFERERVRQVRLGFAEPKVGDVRDYGIQPEVEG